MKFKFLGITWDFTPLVIMLWVFVGGMLCLLPFGFGNFNATGFLVYFVVLVIYMGLAKTVSAKLDSAMKEYFKDEA